MTDGNLQIEAGKRGDKRGRRIAMDENDIGTFLFQYLADAL